MSPNTLNQENNLQFVKICNAKQQANYKRTSLIRAEYCHWIATETAANAYERVNLQVQFQREKAYLNIAALEQEPKLILYVKMIIHLIV